MWIIIADDSHVMSKFIFFKKEKKKTNKILSAVVVISTSQVKISQYLG